jgi:tetratricopeptide (TPR) repeat protein
MKNKTKNITPLKANYFYFIVCTLLAFVLINSRFIFASATIESLESQLTKNSSQIKIREKLGKAYWTKKNYKKVIETLAIYSNEISNDSLVILAESYFLNGDKNNRIRMLEIYVEREPDRFKSNHLLGKALLDAEKYNDAAPYLRRAIELAPKHRPSYDVLLEMFIKTKNNYEARVLVQDMQKIFGNKKEFDNHLCRLYTLESYLEQAENSCLLAVKNDPKTPENHVYLAQAYYDQKNKTAAERIFKTSANQFKASEFVQYAAGQFYLEEKNFPAAVRYLQTAVKLKNDSYRSHLVLAMALYESRKVADALPHYKRACELDKTKDAIKEFRVASAKLYKGGDVEWANKYDSIITVCSGP